MQQKLTKRQRQILAKLQIGNSIKLADNETFYLTDGTLVTKTVVNNLLSKRLIKISRFSITVRGLELNLNH